MVSLIRIDSNYEDDDGLLQMFCESASKDPHPAARNMEFYNWEKRPETLLYKIYIEKLFDTGGYFLMLENGVFTAGSGYYTFEYDSNVAVSPVRLYAAPTTSTYRRARNMSYVSYKFLDEEIFKKYKGQVFFLNYYNEYGVEYTLRAGNVKKNKSRDYWPVKTPIHYKKYESKVIYNNEKQTAIYASWCGYDSEIEKCLKKLKSI